MSEKDTLYYLSADEIAHYRYIIKHGYDSEVIDIGSQKYVVFQVIDKPEIGIAWPTINGGIQMLDEVLDTLFEYHIPLQEKILPKVKDKDIKILLFPRYGS